MPIIEEAAERNHATLVRDGYEMTVSDRLPAVGGQVATLNTPLGTYTEVPIAKFGEHQAHNALAALAAAEERLGTQIYLVADEPYREITYGIEVPWVPSLYARTIVCYSYSKALSLPGERIGWVYVSDAADDGDAVAVAVAGAGRALGYVCAPVLLQRVAARCVAEPSDVAAYAENRAILTEGLSALGYEYVEPDGAFYLWVRALEEDAQAFSDRAKEYELLIVPSDSFGVGGWVRVSYCVSREVIERGAEMLGWDLDTLIEQTILAMRASIHVE